MSDPAFDALLIVAFGGPEGPNDVVPFLENVLAGRNVPRSRLQEVAQHYLQFGGVSPLNQQIRDLRDALVSQLAASGPPLPVYWGNRNWHPLLPDTLRTMADDGVRHALAFFTSPYSSYSSCRQYQENIQQARAAVPSAPQVSKLRAYYNHPGFIEPMTECIGQALERIPSARRRAAQLLLTAHSIPHPMADQCAYQPQLLETSQLVCERLGCDRFQLVYQSRSGPPSQPWLEPDVNDALREIAAGGQVQDVVVAPIGFISDHMEVIYDLDTEARHTANGLGLNFVRAATVGTHPRFVTMIRELIQERLSDQARRLALGPSGPAPDQCAIDCCLPRSS